MYFLGWDCTPDSQRVCHKVGTNLSWHSLPGYSRTSLQCIFYSCLGVSPWWQKLILSILSLFCVWVCHIYINIYWCRVKKKTVSWLRWLSFQTCEETCFSCLKTFYSLNIDVIRYSAHMVSVASENFRKLLRKKNILFRSIHLGVYLVGSERLSRVQGQQEFVKLCHEHLREWS